MGVTRRRLFAAVILVAILFVSLRGILVSMAKLADKSGIVVGMRPVFAQPGPAPLGAPPLSSFVTASELESFRIPRQPVLITREKPWMRKFPRLRGALSALDVSDLPQSLQDVLDSVQDDDGAHLPGTTLIRINANRLALAEQPKKPGTAVDGPITRLLSRLSKWVLTPGPLLSVVGGGRSAPSRPSPSIVRHIADTDLVS